MMNDSLLRKRMVEEQLVRRGISDERVLRAFRKIPRHEFVTPEVRQASYEDHPLPIGEAQTISQPYMVALMTEALALNRNERVLEIGTGSGYQAAVLAELAREVYSIERARSLSEQASGIIVKLGYGNVKFHVGDGTLGWPEQAPYDGIIVTAAAPSIPDAYITQLAENGRLVIPVGTMYSQTLTVIEKIGGKFVSRDLGGCVFVPLVGKNGWSETSL